MTGFYLAVMLIAGILTSVFSMKYDIPVVSWFLDRFEREEYRRKFPGKAAILFVLGSLIALVLFPKDIALASILILSLGDAFAHVFGKILSRRRYVYLKSVEGTIIGIVTGFLGALIFVNPLSAAVGSFAAMGSEAVRTKLFDDNILIPLVAGAVMWLAIAGLG
ncbi:hypothetical protein HZB88_02775 [archaeon]|nr:hypothetical protein [archaeon]